MDMKWKYTRRRKAKQELYVADFISRKINPFASRPRNIVSRANMVGVYKYINVSRLYRA